MRLLLIVFVLVVYLDVGLTRMLSPNEWSSFSGGENLVGRVKNATANGIRKILDKAGLRKIHDKIISMKGKILKTLQLSPKMLQSLNERLSKLRFIKQDKVSKQGDSISEINENAGSGQYLFQSDIALTKKQADQIAEAIEEEARGGNRTKRQALKDQRDMGMMWTEGVNYFFDPSASEKMRRAFVSGAKAWERDTCINFKEDSKAEDSLRVFPELGCWSYTGKLGGQQELSLGGGCETEGMAAHEIGHALGFFHTMSRHDRDNYITVNLQNIKPNWLDQFTMTTPSSNENYGMEYDYGSIMQYGRTIGSINQKPTMIPFDTNYVETLGSPFISFIDLSMMNEHYGCKARCNPQTSAKCSQGGFPHPRNCSRCICPSGYGGALCNERPAGCGAILQATTEFQTLRDVIGEGGDTKEYFVKCHYWIQSPPGKRIEVKIEKLTHGYAVEGCTYEGVEIKANSNHKLTGYRFCAPEDAGMVLRSQGSNLVPIITYTRIARTETVLKYRYLNR
ncbi:astacin [Ancylostoma duodenale]|uniref:Zinc metalloproteinase n=1 Tax=Ancylostoma duodenale TaxID=51022 RepID=A0A0C2GAB1_9BILA|nr:astacin [Ancylostoma duodenale]